MPACLRFVRKELREISPTEDANLAGTAMRVMMSLLDMFVQVGFSSYSVALTVFVYFRIFPTRNSLISFSNKKHSRALYFVDKL